MRQGSEYPIGEAQALIVGRDAEVDLVLSDGIVSRRHARLTTGDDGLWIEDLKSTNGTFVNGVKVSTKAQALREGRRMYKQGVRTFRAKILTGLGRIEERTYHAPNN